MIDPLISLAFAIQANKGAHALLLGSGVSRGAEIPTGWEIVLDLITKLAHLQNDPCGPDPAAWYRSKYGVDPNYAELLDQIAKSPEERQQLLAGYFEPTDEEREDGSKLPTAAHRAIAKLVARGYVRVIVTTNFDRLVERAIEDEGITPTVLSTPDAIEGARPLVHQRCLVVKVHGDYLDTRIKNTPQELGEYDGRVNSLLDRILDEFGVLICGWSGQWDTALLAAFQRCKSRRFTTYWAGRGKLADAAQRLLESRAGVLVPIRDADSFLSELAEKVIGLEDLQQPHPLSVASAAATVKRYLADDKHLIRLHDLVQQETERAFVGLQPVFDSLLGGRDGDAKLVRAVSEFLARLELLRTIGIYGAYWGQQQHLRPFIQIPSRLAVDPKEGQGGVQLNETLRVIPSVITLYTMGVAALAGENFDALAAFLAKPTLSIRGERRPYLLSVNWHDLQTWFKRLPEHEQQRHYFPASEWLFTECREIVRPVVPDDSDYDRLFDDFEMIRSLAFADLSLKGQYGGEPTELRGPPGRFVWKTARRGSSRDFLAELKGSSRIAQGLCSAGLFGGRVQTFGVVVDRFGAHLQTMAQRCD